MRVIVTRPQREAQQWVHDLLRQGIGAVALPLIEIAPAPDAAALQQARQRLSQFQAVMFVSGNAVVPFFMPNPAAARAEWAHGAIKTRAWAPGPGTRQALLQAGVPDPSIDSPPLDTDQFDSEALWQQVRGQLAGGDRVLIVRGGDASGRGSGRDWLAAQLRLAGVEVETVVAYSRRPPSFTAQQRAQAGQAAADGSLWLFSSSVAIDHLRSLLPQQAWNEARALATHPRIAQAAREAGFGVVCLSRPTLADVVASIESSR
jgi:uroporphyrinogen-III synthase